MKALLPRILVALLGLAVTSLAHASGDAAAGKVRAAACAACHGEDGNSPNPVWPKLAGQHASYLVKQLQDLKAGTRKDPMMGPMAMGLSSTDMANLGAWYSSQKVKAGSVDKAQAALGEKLYRGGNRTTGLPACMSCHGPDGAGVPPAFPALSGQHAEYTAKQLTAFRSGERSNDAGKMMRDIAAKLSEAEIKALAAYISALH